MTHLSQITAFAEWHIRVQKTAIHGGTVVGASRRCTQGRNRELEEMMRTSAKAGKSIAMQMFEATRQIRQKILATAWAAPVLVDAASQLSRGRGKGEG